MATHCALSLAMLVAMVAVGCGREGDGLQAGFKAEPTSGTAPLEMQFTDQSTGSITAWKWDFNNDGTIDSTEQNPSHVYTEPGDYDVILEVTGPEGSDTKTKSECIKVSEPSGAISTGAPSLRFDAGWSVHKRNYPSSLPWHSYDVSFGKKVTNDGGPGEILVSVKASKTGNLVGATLFHIDGGEIVLVWAGMDGLSSQFDVDFEWVCSFRPAEPGDESEDGFGSVWVERTSWNPDKAEFTLISSRFYERSLAIEFATTFCGTAELLNPDNVTTGAGRFSDRDTNLSLLVTDSQGNIDLGSYTLLIEGSFGETIASFALDSSYNIQFALTSTQVSNNDWEATLEIEFATTFSGTAELSKPDGETTSSSFGSSDTRLELEMGGPLETPKPGRYTLIIKADLFDEVNYSFTLDFTGACAGVSNLTLQWEERTGSDEGIEYCLAAIDFNIENTGDLPLWLESFGCYVDGTQTDWFLYTYPEDGGLRAGDWLLPGEVVSFSDSTCDTCLTPGTHSLVITLEDRDGTVTSSYSTTVTVGG